MPKTDDFWFKFFPQKWMSGVAFMNYEERGLYITLLCYQHQSGRIPQKTISFLVGSDSVKVWDAIKSKFKIDDQGNYYNEFLEQQIAERLNFNASRQENGKKGGRPKAETKATENLVVNLQDNLPKTYPNSSSISNYNSESIDNSGVSIISIGGMQGGNDFSDDLHSQAVLYREFLQAYGDFGRAPKRGSIEQALIDAVRRLQSLRPDATIDDCCRFLVAQARINCESDIEKRQTKRLNPETWLQNRVYESDLSQIKQAQALSPSQKLSQGVKATLAKIIAEDEAKAKLKGEAR